MTTREDVPNEGVVASAALISDRTVGVAGRGLRDRVLRLW